MPDAVEPAVSAWFGVKFDGGVTGAFRECSGLDGDVAMVEYKASATDGKMVHIKVPGRPGSHDITLKRGVTDSMEFWNWFQKVEDGNMGDARKNGTITLFSPAGKPVAKFDFTAAWPTKIAGPSFNAATNEIAIEELTITHTGYIRSS
jgi:phage tail-like protein